MGSWPSLSSSSLRSPRLSPPPELGHKVEMIQGHTAAAAAATAAAAVGFGASIGPPASVKAIIAPPVHICYTTGIQIPPVPR